MTSRYEYAVEKDGNAYNEETERLLVTKAQPKVAQILSRYRSHRALTRQDAQDVAATVSLRLLQKIRSLNVPFDESVEKFEDYVATMTHNVINDHLRTRYPAKSRLKNRLRYALAHDSRLSITKSSSGMLCGLRQWPATQVVPAVTFESLAITPAMRNARHPSDALVAIFTALGRSVSLEALVTFTASLWNVVDVIPVEVSDIVLPRHHSDTARHVETREYLRALWIEIRQLRPLQRKALLLNLRESGSVDAISLLILTGTAGFAELAATLDMSEKTLASLWNELPLDDFRIAAMLGLTRQQVINLRRAARARLSRRMSMRDAI